MKWIHLACVLCFASQAAALETIYVIRHAEKEKAWPSERELSSMQPLTAAGMHRADAWAEHLAESGIAAVYASQTTRSLHTGLPVAKKMEAPLIADMRTVRADEVADFIAEMKSKHAEDRAILIVGHSNTVPFFLEAAGIPESCMADLGVSEHSYGPGIEGNDGIWALKLDQEGCDGAQMQRLP